MDAIYFGISSKVSVNTLVEFCSAEWNLNVADFKVIEDFYEHSATADFDPKKYYIQYSIHSGEFDAWVEIFSKNELFSEPDYKVNFLLSFSKSTHQNIAIHDPNTIHPDRFILIEPSGATSTFDVESGPYNEKEEINYGQLANACFGQFALKTSFDTNRLEAKLGSMFSDCFTSFELQFAKHAQAIDEDFSRRKLLFKELYDYNFFYSILPTGKQPWNSQKVKSEVFVERMVKMSTDLQLDVCLFPANYSETKNIEGGSDNEAFCLHCSKGETTKIVYKRRRNSWNKSWLTNPFGT